LGGCLLWAVFLKISEEPRLFGLLFSPQNKLCIEFKKIEWAKFWAFFSWTHLVTLHVVVVIRRKIFHSDTFEVMYYIILTKKMCWPKFSQTHLVTLTLTLSLLPPRYLENNEQSQKSDPSYANCQLSFGNYSGAERPDGLVEESTKR
jgi:hypothetical protein